MLNPSRESLPEYLAYRNEVEQAAARVNERWATRDWEPVILDQRDDYPRSLAGSRAQRRAAREPGRATG